MRRKTGSGLPEGKRGMGQMHRLSTRNSAGPPWLAQFPALAKIKDEAWMAAVANAKHRTLPRRSAVFHEHDFRDSFILVLAGKIRVFTNSPAGREIILYTVGPGEVCLFNAFSLLDEQRGWPASGTTEGDIDVVIIDEPHFRNAFDESTAFRNYVCGQIAAQVRRLLTLFVQMAFKRLDVRLAELLCEMMAEHGVKLRVTHHDLSIRIGSPREVVTRMLKDFERRGWIHRRRGCIEVVDPETLAEFCKTA